MLQFRSKKYQEKMKNYLLSNHVVREGEQIFGSFDQKMEQKENFWEKWDRAEEWEKKNLAEEWYDQRKTELSAVYKENDLEGKIQIIELLGFVKEEKIVDFLLDELKNADETLSIACCAALKKQDPLLILEPMLDAICNPQNFAIARLYDILKDIGPLLVPYILQKMPGATQKSKLVMIQLLGEFGDERVIETLEGLLENEDYALRKALAESLGKIASPKGQEALCVLLKDKNWQVRLLAAEALARYKKEEIWQELENAYIKETDKVVKAILEEALESREKMPEAMIS